MSEEQAVVTEVVADTSQAETTETEPTETVVETSTEETTETVSEDNYDWVPKKYMRDGKPDFQAMEKARANLEKKLSQKGVSLAPETPDEYDYTFNLPGVNIESTAEFKEEALKMGLSTDQYTALMQRYEAEIGHFIQTPEKAAKVLKESWGDDYATNMKLANRAFEEYVPSDVSLEEIGNNPAIIKILARIGAELGEDSSPARSNGRSGSSHTQAEIEAMMLTPDYHDGKSEVRQTVNAWFRKNG